MQTKKSKHGKRHMAKRAAKEGKHTSGYRLSATPVYVMGSLSLYLEATGSLADSFPWQREFILGNMVTKKEACFYIAQSFFSSELFFLPIFQ